MLAFAAVAFSPGLSETLRELLEKTLLIAWVTLTLLAIVDAYQSGRRSGIRFSRHIAGNLALGQTSRCRISIEHPYSQAVALEILDNLPANLRSDALPLRALAEAGRVTVIDYPLRTVSRGQGNFDGLHYKQLSGFGLWHIVHHQGLQSSVKVYPDFVAVANYNLLATDHHLSRLGILQKPRRGQGTDFHQLREYRDGDSLRQVDWKATSRLNKLISKEYQDERDQNIILMIDTGRRLRTKDDVLSHFDHALNSLLLLAYIALKQGDAVGMMSIGSEVRWMPPFRGAQKINRLLNQFYDLYPGNATSDYLQAARELSLRHKKRSLIILVSNLRDEDSDDLLAASRLLKKRHLVLLANLREPVLDEIQHTRVVDLDTALDYLSSHYYIKQRQRISEYCHAQGLFTIDCHPAQLSVKLVNRYHAMKRAGYF